MEKSGNAMPLVPSPVGPPRVDVTGFPRHRMDEALSGESPPMRNGRHPACGLTRGPIAERAPEIKADRQWAASFTADCLQILHRLDAGDRLDRSLDCRG